MLISNPEFKASACCVLILTIIVANGAAGAALERQFDDRSTNEKHQDWRQPLPTVKRSVALLNKLVMVAQRANNYKPRHQQQYPLSVHQSSQSQEFNEINQHREADQLSKHSAESTNDDPFTPQKAFAQPRIATDGPRLLLRKNSLHLKKRMTSKFCAIVPVAIVLYLAALAAAKPTDPDDPEFIDFVGDIESKAAPDEGSVETALLNYLFAKQIMARLRNNRNPQELMKKRSYWKQCAFNAVSCFGK
ncbi:putative allatostatin C preprohormone [Daphnia sinensis]|uniref:Allatostatin C preprohormone n=1 Tax=Daphnia sinensis TaxID=1820382 RepID=A0AAD5PYG8_9CRUS|nr:putative allatostatin C preprohormone [Daphnia sinensis]